MERYLNRNGNSNVEGFEIGNDFITIKFKGSVKTYTYSYRRAGRNHVEKMKSLALGGVGLNSYVMTHVRKTYD